MPNLTPIARSTLASWFAFHLIHTDYQWPVSYWQHWEQDEDIWNSPSRKGFVKETLSRLVANTYSPKVVVQDCLPEQSQWVNELLSPLPENSSPHNNETATMEMDLQQRFANYESAEDVLKYLSESSEVTTMAKICAVVAALFLPATNDHRRQLGTISGAEDTSEESGDAIDVSPLLIDQLKRYLPPLAKGLVVADAEVDKLQAEGLLMEEIVKAAGWSDALFKRCLQFLVEHQLMDAKDIIRWQLKHCESSSTSGGGGNWWDIVAFVIHLELRKTMLPAAKGAAGTVDYQSVVATETSGTNAAAAAANAFLEDTLRFLVTSVIQLVVSSERQAVGHRLPRNQVSLVEGLKNVVCQTEKMYTQLFSSDAWAESSFNGPQIAQSIEVAGLPAIDLLQSSLKSM
jgi:hypothetical protein